MTETIADVEETPLLTRSEVVEDLLGLLRRRLLGYLKNEDGYPHGFSGTVQLKLRIPRAMTTGETATDTAPSSESSAPVDAERVKPPEPKEYRPKFYAPRGKSVEIVL